MFGWLKRLFGRGVPVGTAPVQGDADGHPPLTAHAPARAPIPAAASSTLGPGRRDGDAKRHLPLQSDGLRGSIAAHNKRVRASIDSVGQGREPTLTVPPVRPSWLQALPPRVLFVDVETTGFHSSDRIVSFAGIEFETAALPDGVFALHYVHLVFDPGKKSHPRAAEVHGYDDWTLRHQNPFAAHAHVVNDFVERADLIVAHNAKFDIDFLDRELIAAGHQRIRKPIYCTMEAHRRMGVPGRATLSNVAGQIGLQRGGVRHGALEDAWLAMMVYLSQHGCPSRVGFAQFSDPAAKNLVPAPPMPAGALPRRKRVPALLRPRKSTLLGTREPALAPSHLDDRVATEGPIP